MKSLSASALFSALVLVMASLAIAPHVAYAQEDAGGWSSDLMPDSSYSSDLLPASGYSSDLLPASGYSSDLLPASGYSSDLLPASGYSSDLLPATSYSSDLLPATTYSSDLLPATTYSSDLLPQSTPTYSYGGYDYGSYGGYSGGYYGGSYGYSYPNYYAHPYNYYPTTPTVTTPSTYNNCVGTNNCNTTNTVNNPPAQQIVYSTPTYYQPAPVYYQQPIQVCNTCACNSAYCPRVAYNSTPYVTLSAVPYTGLDLGPIGTVIYWSFLVLFSLFGAYLVVVKRAHLVVARSLQVFLFGSSDEPAAPAHAAPAAPHTEAPVAPAVAQSQNADKTDDFILSQINRARA